jgi:ketosteroid isomerase-like protein
MKRFILLTLISMVFASVTAGAQSADVGTKEIRAWLERWTKALKTKDLDEIMALYSDDVIAYDVVPPLQYVGKAAYRGDYQIFLSQYEGDLNVELRDLHVGAAGEFGYATALEMISGTLKSGQKSNVGYASHRSSGNLMDVA